MASLLAPVSPPPAVSDGLWRLSVDQYHAMIDAGILDADSRVELVEGILLEKMSKKPPHTFSTEELIDALRQVLGPGWFVRSQDPITLSDSEPEPDIVVVRGTRRDFLKKHPGPADVALVIEISESSLARDRGIKQRVYARAGIPVYLVVDLVNRRVEVRTAPEGDAYKNIAVYAAGDSVPIVIEGREVGTIPVDAIIPEPPASQTPAPASSGENG